MKISTSMFKSLMLTYFFSICSILTFSQIAQPGAQLLQAQTAVVDVVVGNPYDDARSSDGSRSTPIANPDVPADLLCADLKIVFILDESNSINTLNAVSQVRNAAASLADALKDSGAELRVIEFATTSNIINLGPSAVVNNSFISNFNNYLYSNYLGQSYSPTTLWPCVGWTNWEDALIDAQGLPADIVFFFTDGDPTAYNVNSGGNCSNGTVEAAITNSFNYSTALNKAVDAANVLKNQ